MNRIAIMLAGIGVATAALPTAVSAQAWVSIDQRQRNLDARIDQGIRSGALNRPEAARLRAQYADLVRLERRYRANGLSRWERNDLNARFDRLSAHVYTQKHDRNVRRY